MRGGQSWLWAHSPSLLQLQAYTWTFELRRIWSQQFKMTHCSLFLKYFTVQLAATTGAADLMKASRNSGQQAFPCFVPHEAAHGYADICIYQSSISSRRVFRRMYEAGTHGVCHSQWCWSPSLWWRVQDTADYEVRLACSGFAPALMGSTKPKGDILLARFKQPSSSKGYQNGHMWEQFENCKEPRVGQRMRRFALPVQFMRRLAYAYISVFKLA